MLSILRVVAAFILALSAASASGATVDERSPFTQGHWWDPTHSGHGFEIFNAGGQVAVVWYTYDEAGNPTWYYAQGALADLATKPLALLRTHWSDGRLAGSSTVGSLKLDVKHPEGIDLAWDIGGHAGTWKIRPFIAAGAVSEVDHTGHWYEPAHNGWGFTLAEQGDVLGAVLYFYDTAGEPTWRAGFGRAAAQRKVDLFSTRGPCPYCVPLAVTSQPAGAVTFDYRSDGALTISSTMSAPLASGLHIDGASAIQLGRPASTRPADRQLATFGSNAALLAYMREGMKNIRTLVLGGSDFSAAPPSAAPYSPTNLQEAGVDEGALVVTDGRFVDAFRYNDLGTRLATVRIAEVEGNGASARARDSFELAAGERSPVAAAALFRYSDRLVAITGSQALAAPGWALSATTGWQNGVTNVEVFDAADPAAPTSRWRASFDGHLLASRRIGDRLFLVLRHVPSTPTNLLLTEVPLETFLPKVRIDGGAAIEAVPRSAFHAPPLGAIPATADMTIVHEIDLAARRITASLSVVGSVETVYVSTGAIYLATTRTAYRDTFGNFLASAGGSTLTDIHRIVLDGGLHVGQTGTLEGFLSRDPDQAQFRLSEQDGRLRVVTSTSDASWWGEATRNRLTILEPSTVNPGVLKTIAYLPNAQRPEPLGEAQENLYATRFLGDRLYAVTFRIAGIRVDPLYTVDLSVPTDPRIRGQLVIPGFSEYLHPVAPGYLVGFGRNVMADGLDTGLKVSLFDVRDDAMPREVASVPFGWAGSASALQRHHHAFSALLAADGSGTFALPARLTTGTANLAWDKSGLMRFALRKSGSALTLEALPNLITASNQSSPWLAHVSNDPAATDARSIIFPSGTLYSGGGWFWLLDAGGNVTGPF